MSKRLTSNLYVKEDFKYDREIGHWTYQNLPDGRLYSYKTKYTPTSVTEKDLPEWYLYGRYHKRFGYLNTKDIKYARYFPLPFPENHILKDDALLISFSEPITKVQSNTRDREWWSDYSYDLIIDGSEIISVLMGMAKYGGWNILPFKEQIWEKIEKLREEEQEYVNRVVSDRECFESWWKD